MQRVELEFVTKERSWSPDHGSIQFSGWCEGREIRFFVPRASLTALSQQAEIPTEYNYIGLFDANLSAFIDAAKLVFAKDGRISSAYVITDAAIEAVLRLSAAGTRHLAA